MKATLGERLSWAPNYGKVMEVEIKDHVAVIKIDDKEVKEHERDFYRKLESGFFIEVKK